MEVTEMQELLQKYINQELTIECELSPETDKCLQEIFKDQDKKYQFIKEAISKHIPMKPIHIHDVHKKHKWKKNDLGEPDEWAWEYEFHNGVECEVCGETVCVHCEPDYMDLECCILDEDRCPSCGAEIERGKKFCSECGQALDIGGVEK